MKEGMKEEEPVIFYSRLSYRQESLRSQAKPFIHSFIHPQRTNEHDAISDGAEAACGGDAQQSASLRAAGEIDRNALPPVAEPLSNSIAHVPSYD
jgi:hypothetical protein